MWHLAFAFSDELLLQGTSGCLAGLETWLLHHLLQLSFDWLPKV